MPGRAAGPGAGRAEADFADYLHARWPRLVAALEAEQVDPDEARLAVAEVMLEHRRGWTRLVREQQVDVLVWREVRERLGLPPGPALPPDVGADPAAGDVPETWLPRAEASLSRRRARRLRRGVAILAVAALLLGALAWWDARPDPPDVRAERNPLPVTWYAAGELHLAEVVVELPQVEAFAAYEDGVAVRHTDGRLVLVTDDGSVRRLDEEPVELARPMLAPTYDGGSLGVTIQTVRLPDGRWAHLVDSSRRVSDRGEVRLSETGRRVVVICPAPAECEPPRTIPEAGVTIRLR